MVSPGRQPMLAKLPASRLGRLGPALPLSVVGAPRWPRVRAARGYASSSGTGLGTRPEGRSKQRPAVTPFNDDGRVPWSQLSTGEKAARTAQQSFNLGLVLVGLVLTGAVSYYLWTDVFSPDSKTSHFNRAFDKIRKDSRCIGLLGDADTMTAHGEETYNKWRRARPLAASQTRDDQGNEHLLMHFHVTGALAKGVAQAHLVKRRGEAAFGWRSLALDVPGHARIYLEGGDEETGPPAGSKPLRFFGVRWA